MSKLGLVFAGGGGKGSYEVGVWKAFKEFGIDKNISAISGTSVGGLNGALFTKGDFEQGLKVWQEMNPQQILQIRPEQIISALAKIFPQTRIPTLIGEKLGFLKSQGIFSQKGLENIIRASLKDGDLKDKIPFYVCVTDITDITNESSLKPIYKKLNDLDYETIVQYLLATSAIPVAFAKIEIEGKELIDGFLTDNTPFKPLIEIEKCDKIIVVLLGRSELITQEKLKYSNVVFWEIVPTGDTKESIGSLDFKAETAKNLITMGYNDTIKILQNLYEFMLIEQEYLQKGETLKVQHNGFVKSVVNNSLLRSEYKKLKENYNDINSLQYLLENPKSKKKLINYNSSSTSLDTISKELSLQMEDFEVEAIDINIDEVLEKMGKNSIELSKFAFSSITSLSSSEGRINYQNNQGFFSRIWGGITGDNHKVQTDINYSFSKAIYANTQMIKKLAERNNLTLDMCISLGNKINFLANNQNLLQEQNIEQFHMINGLRSSILSVADLTKNALVSTNQRIDKLEYGQELLNWAHHLKSSIKGLNDYEAILKILDGYFSITNNSTENYCDEFLYSTLVNLDFDKIKINPSNFIEYVLDGNLSNNNLLPISKDYESITPVYSIVSKITQGCNESRFDDIMSNFENSYGINLDVQMSGVDFAFEFLNGYKFGYKLHSSLDNSKDEMIKKLDNLLEILNDDKIDTFTQDIENLKNKIKDFKVIIPIIGKFSAGKSKLLNSYLSSNEKLFQIDTNPTTSLATEILYGEKNIIKVYDKNNNITEYPLNEYNKIDDTQATFIQYLLNYPKVKSKQNLVLVDMPGFESNNLDHNNAINRYFNKGHHYILTLSCESVNDHSILKNIKEILSYDAKFSIVITKADKKLPKDIEALKAVLIQNINNKFPNEKFIVGITSSAKNNISDFETIVDTIYEDSVNILNNVFFKEINLLKNEIEEYYKKFLNLPNNTIELEKQLSFDKTNFENEISRLNSKLQEIKFDITSDAYINFKDKISAVLNANISSLIQSAKSGNIGGTITDLLRVPLNSMFKKLVDKSVKFLEDEEKISLSTDLNISFGGVHIDTKLSFIQSIIDFIFNTQEKELQFKFQNEIIPNAVINISDNIKNDLDNLYNEIEKYVLTNIKNKENKKETLEKELHEKIKLQTQDYENMKIKYQDSLNEITKVLDEFKK